MRLELIFRGLQAPLLLPRSPALAENLEPGVALVDELAFDQALEHPEAAVASDLVALRTREQDDLDRLAFHLLGEPLADEIAVLVVGRAHLGDHMRLGVDARIHHDDLDAGLGGGVGGGDEALGVARVEDEKVDALRDHVLDVRNLLAHVVLAVGLRDLASGLLGLVDGGRDLGGEIGALSVYMATPTLQSAAWAAPQEPAASAAARAKAERADFIEFPPRSSLEGLCARDL